MLERFQGRRRGQISIRDFMRGMKVDMSRHSEVDDIDAVQDEVRREIKRLAETRYGRPKFRQGFEEIDRDGGGTIDRREFKKALEQLGFELSSRVVKKLFKKFDTNYDGEIGYREFQKFAEGDSDYARSSRDRSPRSSRSHRYDDEEDIDEDMRKLRREVQKAVDSGTDVIECFDTDGGGSIDEDEFYRGLQKLDFDVSRSEARKMLERFPGRRRGQISIRDFMRGMKVDMSRHSEVDDIDAVQDEVRREIKRLAETRYGRPKFRQVFEEIDRDGGGTIDR